MVTIECQHCGIKFQAWPNRVKSGRRKFCTRKCKDEYQKALTGDKSPRKGKYHTRETIEKIERIAQDRARVFMGEKHPMWKGGTYVAHGYRYLAIGVLTPEDQVLAQPMARKSGYIMEHRLVMARKLNRPLEKTEIVHHLNGEKLDNRPENLTVMEGGPHSREHRRIDHELTKLREENRRLRSLLMTYLPDGSDISSLLENM